MRRGEGVIPGLGLGREASVKQFGWADRRRLAPRALADTRTAG